VLDLTDAGVKKMIKLAKQRGFVTYDELNEVLPSDEVTSEQIEDIMAMLTDMGINVVETEEESEDTTEVAESAQTGVVKSESNTTTSGRPHRRSGADVPARDGLGGACCRARARLPLPSASRQAARR
jgi:RNA polymerase primary sigma factor